jgi:hypothetical protein
MSKQRLCSRVGSTGQPSTRNSKTINEDAGRKRVEAEHRTAKDVQETNAMRRIAVCDKGCR